MKGSARRNLNEISRKRNKLEEQKMALGNIKLLYKSREAVIVKLFNYYYLILSEVKCKKIHGAGIPSMLLRVARVAKDLDCKVSDHSIRKLLSLKQMLQNYS